MLSGPLYIETVFSSFGFFALALLLIGLKSSAPLQLEPWDSEDSRASELSVGSRELFGRYRKGSYGGGSWDLGAKPCHCSQKKYFPSDKQPLACYCALADTEACSRPTRYPLLPIMNCVLSEQSNCKVDHAHKTPSSVGGVEQASASTED